MSCIYIRINLWPLIFLSEPSLYHNFPHISFHGNHGLGRAASMTQAIVVLVSNTWLLGLHIIVTIIASRHA